MPDASSTNKDVSQRIILAALETIAANKISGTNLRDIATRTGISQGTLHYYFPSKTGLYQAVLEYMSCTFSDQRKRKLEDINLKPRDKLNVFFTQMREVLQEKEILLAFYDFWVQSTGETRESVIQEAIQRIYNRWRGDIDNVVREGVAQGEFNSQHANLIPTLMVSLMEGAALQFLVDVEAIDLEAYFKKANQIILSIIEI
ncbi:MAG: TetR/AcrR family transcriptional regulator [Anaerolineaceae bacterium]|nr:TetR/AcrR family transcriptional regulator [Anaerolineaceae bacterium]